MNISQIIMHLFPGAQPIRDFLVMDVGEGQFIAEWNLPNPQPTLEELEAVWLSALKELKIREFKAAAKAELDATDYKVIRHRDQVAAEVPTSLSEEQYIQLLLNRNSVRNKSNELEQQVNEATTEEAVALIIW